MSNFTAQTHCSYDFDTSLDSKYIAEHISSKTTFESGRVQKQENKLLLNVCVWEFENIPYSMSNFTAQPHRN